MGTTGDSQRSAAEAVTGATEVVSEARSGDPYDAHSYHTKVPPRAIAQLIERYAGHGGTIGGAYCGSGTTGVAAALAEAANGSTAYAVVLGDLSPYATFIANALNSPPPEELFRPEAKAVLRPSCPALEPCWTTDHIDGRQGQIFYTIWSEALNCPACADLVRHWDAAVDQDHGFIRRDLNCACGHRFRKADGRRQVERDFDALIGEWIARPVRDPVLVTFEVDGRRYRKAPDHADLERVAAVEELPAPYAGVSRPAFDGRPTPTLSRGGAEAGRNEAPGEVRLGVPVVDVFSGAGGLSLGLRGVGFEPVVAVEIDRYACETYARMHPNVDLLEADIRQIGFRRLKGEVALVAGGPPCQPFSTGGLRRGATDPRDGFPEFLRVLREVQPEAFLIENVAGLGRGRTRSYLRALLTELEVLGFEVEWKTLSATDYGVPQRRERVFIVGTRGQQFEFPLPTHGPGRPRAWEPAGTVLKVNESFGEPNPSIVTYARKPDLRPSPYDGLLFNGGGRPIDFSAPARTILASAGGNKTPFVDTQGVVPPYHAYLLAGGKPRKGRVPGARRITVAESAALQTFPRDAYFAGPRSAQYTLVGNAVPPRLAEAVGRSLLEAIRGSARRVRAA